MGGRQIKCTIFSTFARANNLDQSIFEVCCLKHPTRLKGLPMITVDIMDDKIPMDPSIHPVCVTMY